jgi:transcriptional regulator with XRE-family HTH domain
VRSLSEIIKLKIKELDISQAELGRRIMGLSGQQIGYYMAGKQAPSIDFAVKWKEVFNENLIDLILEEELPATQNPTEKDTLKDELIDCQRKLIKCTEERERYKDELETLKKFGPTTGTEQLKKKEVKH